MMIVAVGGADGLEMNDLLHFSLLTSSALQTYLSALTGMYLSDVPCTLWATGSMRWNGRCLGLMCSTRLELDCKHWWGYLLSSTGEGGLLIGLLAGMPASSALSLMLVGGSLSTGDLSVFTGTNYSILTIPILCICVFYDIYLLPPGCSSPFCCCHVKV